MKIQVNVDKEVWRQARVEAMGRGKTMGEWVQIALVELRAQLEMKGKLVIPGEKVCQDKAPIGNKEFKAAVESVAQSKQGQPYDPFKERPKLDLSKVPVGDKRGRQ